VEEPDSEHRHQANERGAHMSQGQELHVREHQFLAASQNIDYSFERVKGISNMLMGGTGFFIDKFHSHRA
jgi:uncharacterized protein (AIM24 family)